MGIELPARPARTDILRTRSPIDRWGSDRRYRERRCSGHRERRTRRIWPPSRQGSGGRVGVAPRTGSGERWRRQRPGRRQIFFDDGNRSPKNVDRPFRFRLRFAHVPMVFNICRRRKHEIFRIMFALTASRQRWSLSPRNSLHTQLQIRNCLDRSALLRHDQGERATASSSAGIRKLAAGEES